MEVVVVTVVIASIGSVLALLLLVIVITGIRVSERRMNLAREPLTWAEMVTRQVLGGHFVVRETRHPVMAEQRRD